MHHLVAEPDLVVHGKSDRGEVAFGDNVFGVVKKYTARRHAECVLAALLSVPLGPGSPSSTDGRGLHSTFWRRKVL